MGEFLLRTLKGPPPGFSFSFGDEKPSDIGDIFLVNSSMGLSCHIFGRGHGIAIFSTPEEKEPQHVTFEKSSWFNLREDLSVLPAEPMRLDTHLCSIFMWRLGLSVGDLLSSHEVAILLSEGS